MDTQAKLVSVIEVERIIARKKSKFMQSCTRVVLSTIVGFRIKINSWKPFYSFELKSF